MRNKSVNKKEFIIWNTFINIEIDCKQTPRKYCNNDGISDLFVFTVSFELIEFLMSPVRSSWGVESPFCGCFDMSLEYVVEWHGPLGFSLVIYWYLLFVRMLQVDSLLLSTVAELAGGNC